MTEQAPPPHDAGAPAGEHSAIHLPPPSFVPINIALALTTTLVGFIDQVRSALGPLVWGLGLVWLIGSGVVWLRAARSEFNALPDSPDGPLTAGH